VTKRLEQTNRDLLLDIQRRQQSIELLQVSVRLLASTADKLLKENEALMRIVGRMTIERLRAGEKERAR
jgi:hypothetical protein